MFVALFLYQSLSSRGRKIIIISNLCCLSERVVHKKDFGNDDFEEELNFGVAPQFIIVLAAPVTKTVTNCNRLLFFFLSINDVEKGDIQYCMGKILSSISSCQVWILQCHLEVLILWSGANFIFAVGDDLASTTVKKLFQCRKTKVRLTEQVRGRGMPEFLESSFMLYSGILVTRALLMPAFPQQLWSLTIILTQFNSIRPRVHGN